MQAFHITENTIFTVYTGIKLITKTKFGFLPSQKNGVPLTGHSKHET
jgi:hypothetical protein